MARDVVCKRVALLLLVARAGALIRMSVVPEAPRSMGGRRAFFGGVAGVATSAAVLRPGKAAAKTASTAATVSNDFISGLASGAAQRVVKDIVLHPIDTVKTRLQQPKAPRLLSRAALFRPYAGVVPPLVVGVPAGALFFGVKDALGRPFEELFGSEVLAEALTVTLANVPYWIVRAPAELLKTRQQLGGESDTRELLKQIVEQNELYAGAVEAYAYALPTDVIKFVVYRALKERSNFVGSAILRKATLGAAASAVAQITTTPLDVVKTRSMDEEAGEMSIPKRLVEIGTEEGLPALFAGLGPRIVRALVSGFLQFGSYEATKRLFSSS